MTEHTESFRGSVEMIASMIIAGTVGWFVIMTQSGSRRYLASSPHNTLHADPHRAFPEDVLK